MRPGGKKQLAELAARVDSLQQARDEEIADLKRRLERQETRMHEFQLRLEQRLAALVQSQQVEASLRAEARKHQQENLIRLQHAVATHKQELDTLDAALDDRSHTNANAGLEARGG
jgi:chromosome segregation ATPase